MEMKNINWEIITAKKFTIAMSNFGVKNAKLTIWRDDDFRIFCRISTANHKLFNNIHRITNKSLKILSIGEVPNIRLYIPALFILSNSHTSEESILNCEIVSAIYYLRPKKNFVYDYKYFYFLNSLPDFPYSRSQEFSKSEKIVYEITGYSKDQLDFDVGGEYGRNAMTLLINNKTIAFGFVSAKTTETVDGSFIRVDKKNDLNKDEVTILRNILSFMCSSKLIPLGNTVMTKDYTRFYGQYNSTLIDGIKSQLFSGRYIPFPYHQSLGYWLDKSFDIEAILSSVISEYIKNRDTFELDRVTWLVEYARISSVELQIQPLATAYDLLKSCWFNSPYSKSKGRHLQDNVYNEVISKYLTNIESDLDKSKSTTKPILNRIKSANQMSLSEKDIVFFKEMELEMGEVERFALQSRNKVVHGSKGSIDLRNLWDANNAYHTMVNRILLFLLKLDYYVDYSCRIKPNPVRPIKEQMLGVKSNKMD